MKRWTETFLFITSFVLLFSCLTTKKMLQMHFQSLRNKDEIIVVIFGDSISGGRFSGGSASYGSLLKPKLRDLFKSRISMLISSRPYESYETGYRNIQADILSYRPDIVFVMLGSVDTFNRPGLSSTHKENINNFYSILKESGLFVIVLTTPGFRDFKSENDKNAERLEEFNNIVGNVARYYHYPLIDVARYLNDVRLTNPDEYHSLFSDSFTFNEKGMQYIADYIFQRLTGVLGSSFDN